LSLWLQTTERFDGLIWVMDATGSHFGNTGELLEQVVTHSKTNSIPLLLFANKSDMSDAIPISQIEIDLNLKLLKRKWNIFACSATTGQGLEEGFKWITKEALEHRKELKSKKGVKVEQDTAYHYERTQSSTTK